MNSLSNGHLIVAYLPLYVSSSILFNIFFIIIGSNTSISCLNKAFPQVLMNETFTVDAEVVFAYNALLYKYYTILYIRYIVFLVAN